MFIKVVVLCVVAGAIATPPVRRTREEIEAFKAYLENTQNTNGVRVMSRLAENPEANPEELSGKFDGDIILDDSMIEDMVETYALGRNAYIYPNTKWPEDTVVWDFGEGEFNDAQKEAILEGIRDIERHTCLKFRRRVQREIVFVRLSGINAGCYAHVGYSSGRGVHTLNLARATPGTGCFRHATIVHEFLHILGFFHMHATWNRDDYVHIVKDNLQLGTEKNFDLYAESLVSNLGVEYDYVSCMHYGPYAYSKNNQKTIIALKEHAGTMGQREYITASDWLRVNRHYNCPGAWD